MNLIDLDPRWLIAPDGRRVGFIFLSPIKSPGPVHWRQTCFFEPTRFRDQCPIVWAAMADLAGEDKEFDNWQGCNADCQWKVTGGDIAAADFATISVTPSLDGSKGGLWHGYVTAGQIVGGV